LLQEILDVYASPDQVVWFINQYQSSLGDVTSPHIVNKTHILNENKSGIQIQKEL